MTAPATDPATPPVDSTPQSPTAGRPGKSRHPLAPLFTAGTVRLRTAAVLQSVEQNLSGNFRLNRAALNPLAERVASHLQAAEHAAPAWPAYTAPFWHHLQAGGVDRLAELNGLLQHETPAERARAWADLALLGVLMNADPGPRWRYTEQAALPTAAFTQASPDELLALLDRAGKTAAPPAPAAEPPPAAPPVSAGAATGGSAGLALATFRAFVAGAFSSDRLHPCRADAATLRHMDVAALRAMLQGTPQNLSLGLEGRAALLSRWGQMLQNRPGAGGAAARPCDLVDVLAAPAGAITEVQAASLLDTLLRATAATWATPPVQGLPAGDVWPHRWAGEAVGADLGTDMASALETDLGTSGWVPLHAAAQAMVGTLALPLQQHAGCRVLGLQQLTACADHHASSLLLAAGVIVPRQPRLLARGLKLADEAVVECRALTVALFEELTLQVRTALAGPRGANAAFIMVAEVVQACAAVSAAGATSSAAPALTIEGDGALF